VSLFGRVNEFNLIYYFFEIEDEKQIFLIFVQFARFIVFDRYKLSNLKISVFRTI
jgi:hypothetical protein